MTPAEFQEIRDRHTKKVNQTKTGYCVFCYDDFPCDAIKLLEVIEN